MKYIIISLFVYVSLPMHAIKPGKEYIKYPQQMGLIYKTLNVKTDDGYKIATWYFPAQEMPQEDAGSETMLPYKRLDDKKRAAIIICNGDAGNMSYFQLVLAACYTAQGYNVVTFDWRGFGESDHFDMDSDYFCYTEMLLDYQAVITETAKQPETDSSEIFLLGWSTGGYLSMMTAYNHPLVKGCVLRGVPLSFEDIIPLIKSETGKKDANLVVPKDFPTQQMPGVLAPKFNKAIMLIVGAEDTRTPVWMTEKIYKDLPAGILKRMWVVPGAKHGGKDAPEFVRLEEFVTKTIQFLNDSHSKKR